MSVAEPVHPNAALRFAVSSGDLVEVVARRGRHRDLVYAARARELLLPTVGEATWSDTFVTACTRVDRWWIIGPTRPPAKTAARVAGMLGSGAIVVDQSSGYETVDLIGNDWRSALASGCRLDLDKEIFRPGHAAATTIAQVNVVLIPHPSGLLVLVPTTYAQHFREWLTHRATALDLPSQQPTAEAPT